jgi:hypothetical protein
VPSQEVFVPNIVRIEKADERCVKLRQAAPNRPSLAHIVLEPDVVEPGIVQACKAAVDGLIGSVGRRIVNDNCPKIPGSLSRDRFDGFCNECAIVVVGDYDSDGGS